MAVAVLAVTAAACRDPYEGGGALHARQVVLRREVEGLRAIAAKLERGESIIPPGDVAIAIDDSLLRDILSAQLPLNIDAEGFHTTLREAEVSFRGSPVVRLRGTLHPLQRPGLVAQVEVIGAIEGIEVDASSSTLQARIAADHFGIEKAAGLGSYLGGSSLDEVGRLIRLRIADRMPTVRIPVKVQQDIDLPAVTQGAVRFDGARLPLTVSVSEVFAARGTLWIGVHFDPGVVVKTGGDPPPASTPAGRE